MAPLLCALQRFAVCEFFLAIYVVCDQDDEGNALETEFGLSTYRDHQTFSIQVCRVCCWLCQTNQFSRV